VPVSLPPKPEVQWHYATGGKTQGPMSESTLQAALRALPPDTLVWHEGLSGWKSALDAGLKPASAPAFTPPVPSAPIPPPAFHPPSPAVSPSAPALVPPAYGVPVAADIPVQSGPMPPNMPWVVVLILTWITGGLAGLFWAFKQATFVKKIDPSSKAVMFMVLTVAGIIVQVVLALASMAMSSAAALTILMGGIMILNLVIIVAGLVAVFSMRGSIQRYYNTVEPMGLKLSGVMTFFFTILYFQYHFSRIAEWKKTGRIA